MVTTRGAQEATPTVTLSVPRRQEVSPGDAAVAATIARVAQSGLRPARTQASPTPTLAVPASLPEEDDDYEEQEDDQVQEGPSALHSGGWWRNPAQRETARARLGRPLTPPVSRQAAGAAAGRDTCGHPASVALRRAILVTAFQRVTQCVARAVSGGPTEQQGRPPSPAGSYG